MLEIRVNYSIWRSGLTEMENHIFSLQLFSFGFNLNFYGDFSFFIIFLYFFLLQMRIVKFKEDMLLCLGKKNCFERVAILLLSLDMEMEWKCCLKFHFSPFLNAINWTVDLYVFWFQGSIIDFNRIVAELRVVFANDIRYIIIAISV